jgi:multidrug efflux pump subunit AcrB
LRLSRPDRSGIEGLASLTLPGPSGKQVTLREITRVEQQTIDTSVYRKNLRPVVYVTADVAGEVESPVYAILKMSEAIDKISLPEGYQLRQYTGTALPERRPVLDEMGR